MEGVLEYWIADRQEKTIEIYRRENAALERVATLYPEDMLTSPMLPGFSCPCDRIFDG